MTYPVLAYYKILSSIGTCTHKSQPITFTFLLDFQENRGGRTKRREGRSTGNDKSGMERRGIKKVKQRKFKMHS